VRRRQPWRAITGGSAVPAPATHAGTVHVDDAAASGGDYGQPAPVRRRQRGGYEKVLEQVVAEDVGVINDGLQWVVGAAKPGVEDARRAAAATRAVAVGDIGEVVGKPKFAHVTSSRRSCWLLLIGFIDLHLDRAVVRVQYGTDRKGPGDVWDRWIIREFGMVRLCFFYTSRSKILLLIIIVYNVGVES
jgi:hypothetical protein